MCDVAEKKSTSVKSFVISVSHPERCVRTFTELKENRTIYFSYRADRRKCVFRSARAGKKPWGSWTQENVILWYEKERICKIKARRKSREISPGLAPSALNILMNTKAIENSWKAMDNTNPSSEKSARERKLHEKTWNSLKQEFSGVCGHPQVNSFMSYFQF